MILYTMMPQELIFPQNEVVENNHMIIEMNGVSLSVSKTSIGDYVIERVLSTNPQHYLDDKFSPGQKIQM